MTRECNERPHAEGTRVLTTGRLDGLMITPIADEGGIRFLHFTVDTLPGLRLIVEAAAARELQHALNTMLGPKDDGSLDVSRDHAKPWLEQVFDKARKDAATKPIHIDAPARAYAVLEHPERPHPLAAVPPRPCCLASRVPPHAHSLDCTARRGAQAFGELASRIEVEATTCTDPACPNVGGRCLVEPQIIDWGDDWPIERLVSEARSGVISIPQTQRLAEALSFATARIDQLEQEAREARNVLASAIDRIDGGHSTALTDCAERAMYLLEEQRVERDHLTARLDQLAAALELESAMLRQAFDAIEELNQQALSITKLVTIEGMDEAIQHARLARSAALAKLAEHQALLSTPDVAERLKKINALRLSVGRFDAVNASGPDPMGIHSLLTAAREVVG